MFDHDPARPALWVVFYTLHNQRRATRHLEGCGVLRQARANQDAGEYHGDIGQHGVIEEGRYLAHAPADFPAPVDHTCVRSKP